MGRFKNLLTSVQTTDEYINHYMVSRSNELLKKEITIEQRRKLIVRFFPDGINSEQYNSSLKFCSSAGEFKEVFKTLLPKEQLKNFYRSFNKIMSEVSFDKIFYNQEGFLEFSLKYELNFKHLVLENFFSILCEDFEGREFSIIHLAYILQKASRFYNNSVSSSDRKNANRVL